MACVSGSVEADGLACGAPGDCAHSVVARVKAAMAANRIGAEGRMGVRRVGKREVMVSTNVFV